MSLLAVAHEEMGVTEVPGGGSNPRIMEYFKAAGGDWVSGDSVPWCGAFLGYVAAQCGLPLAPEPLRARSWLDWGEVVTRPSKGDVVILKRGTNPEQGHVGIVERVDAGGLYVLGGNQGDKVSIVKFSTADVLGYRRAKETPKERPIVDTLRSSKTILGVLLAFIGTIIQFISDGLSLAVEAAGHLSQWAPAQQLAGALGANMKSVGFGLAVFGLVLAGTRRLQAANEGKAG